MKPVFAVLFFSIIVTQLSAQLVLSYNERKEYQTEYTISPGQSLLISMTRALTPAQLNEFLSKSVIQVLQEGNDDPILSQTLKARINELNLSAENLFKDGKIENFDMIALAKLNSATRKIVFRPYLGKDAQGKPFAGAGKPIIIVLTEKKHSPINDTVTKEALEPLRQDIAENKRGIQKLHREVVQLKEQEALNISRIQNRTEDIYNNLTARIDYARLSKRERKKMEKELKDYSESPSDLSDFKDCPSCQDYAGDLIYDFRCKRLFRAKRLIVNKNNYLTVYKLVKDLTDVKVRAQQLLRLKVVGVNRYLYNVNVNVEDSVYGSEPPALFQQFFSGSSDLFSGLVEKGENSILQDEDIESTAKNDLKEKFSTLKEAMRRFKTEYNILIDKQTKAFLYCLDLTINCCGDDDLKLYSVYSEMLADVLTLLGEIEVLYLAEVPSSTEVLSKINELQGKIDACKKNEKKRADDLTAAEKELKAAGTDEAKVKAAKEKIKKIEEDGCDIRSINNLAEQINKYKLNLPLRLTMDAMKASLPTLAQLRKLYLFDRNIVKDHYFYRLPPIYPQGDKIKIVIDMEARDSTIAAEMGYMPTYHDELNLDFSVRNKAMFSFSAGPYFVFGGELPVRSYGFRRIPTSGTVVGSDATYVLDETGRAPLPIGLGAFAHMGVKIGRNFGIAGTIGAGYSFNQEAILPAFMGGLTTSFGDRQRVNLTFGIAGVQVRELKEELHLGNVYAALPTLEYDKPIRFGYFASVSYSIFTSTSKINIFSRSKK